MVCQSVSIYHHHQMYDAAFFLDFFCVVVAVEVGSSPSSFSSPLPPSPPLAASARAASDAVVGNLAVKSPKSYAARRSTTYQR